MKPADMRQIERVDAARDEDWTYQDRILPHVSRTFALTIPELPQSLRRMVENGYLLCRIADTIEDEPSLDLETKRALHDRFAGVVEGTADPIPFASEVAAQLSGWAGIHIRDLVDHTPGIVRITHAFPRRQRQALVRCVRIMCEGMPRFQETRPRLGLADVRELHSYCYYVAGVVGETLTDLFTAHAADIEAESEELQARAVSFGQGLQMTNILKDIWDDLRWGACWLPDDVFRQSGFDLDELAAGHYSEEMGCALGELIAIAHQHLGDALEYSLIIPRRHAGIRRFCLRAVGMAVLTLRKINRHRDFSATRQVKISRRTVRMVTAVTDLAATRDRTLRLLFSLCSAGQPVPSIPRVEWEEAPSR